MTNNEQSINENETTHNKHTKEVHSSPTMVFSVIGDSDNFVPRPWPKTVFQTALIEAAKSGGGIVLFGNEYAFYFSVFYN